MGCPLILRTNRQKKRRSHYFIPFLTTMMRNTTSAFLFRKIQKNLLKFFSINFSKFQTEIISIASICLLALVIILSILAIVLTIIEIDAIDQFQQNVTETNWYRDPCRLCFPIEDSVLKSQLKRIRVCFFYFYY